MTNDITPYDFFFDSQQKRFLEQIVRAFSGFSYQTGMQNGNPPEIRQVPCTMAYSNRQTAAIVGNNSENTLNAIPHIVVYQTGLRGRKEDLQNRAFIDHRQVFEREIQDGKYGTKSGNAYSVDRIMPLPFAMEIQVDVWVSNLEQKHQLIEQILIAMYPDFQIQNSDNPLDWTANTYCYIEDDIEFSSRSIPVGAQEDTDYFSIRLRLPIWLTPPAKVKRISRIEEVVANVGNLSVDGLGEPGISTMFGRIIVTPGDHFVRVDGNVITLLNSKAGDMMPDDTLPSWTNLIRSYGVTLTSNSALHLLLTADPNGPFVTGTMALGTNPNELFWTIDYDTLPSNTLEPVDAVINPLTAFPGQKLPAATDGTRYLLIEDMGASVGWGNITANAYDIIEYSSTAGQWTIVFNSKTNLQQQYVTNFNTGRQLRWNGAEWVMSIDTFYSPGFWRLAI